MDKLSQDPNQPGIIRWSNNPLDGILAGVRAADIVRAVNCHDDLRAVMQGHIEWLVTLSEDKSIPVEQRRICANYVALGQAALERTKP